MSQTIRCFTLLLVVLATPVQVSANSVVPVSDLVNDVAAQSLATSPAVQPKQVEPSKETLVASTVKANANAQMFDLVELLQQELQQLRGQVEELNYNLERLKNDQKQRYLDLDRRIVSLSSQPLAVNEPQTTSVVSQTMQNNGTRGQGDDATSVEQAIVVKESYDPEVVKAAYKAAFTLIRERQYDESIVALLAFVKDFPQGSLVGNAHYWLGEVYMVQGDASLAALSFEHVIGEFPQHRKIPDALYKAGVAYQNLGNIDKANQMLQRVLLEYPDSSAARLAQERVN